MRFTTSLLLALPALTLAQDQIPLGERLKGWFNKATASIQSAIPSVVPNPVDAGTSKIAEQVVYPINMSNWKDVLKPSSSTLGGPPEEWLIFFDGNKTCYNLCANASKAWNTAVTLISASPHPPKLGRVDCDKDEVLCGMWALGPPSLYHIQLPKALPDQSTPATTVRYIPINRTSITALEIAEVHIKEKYKETEPYEGAFHPFDGWLEKTGINVPMAYFMWGMSKVPSWLPMIVISLLSRSIIGRRMQPGGQQGGRPQGGAAPAGQ